MQQRISLLFLVASVLLVGIVGYTPNVFAIDYSVSDQESCENLPATTVWTLNRCTLNDQLSLNADDVVITTRELVLAQYPSCTCSQLTTSLLRTYSYQLPILNSSLSFTTPA